MTQPHPDPTLLRGLTRRHALRVTALSAATLALTACGVEGRQAPGPTTSQAVHRYWDGKTTTGRVSFANWPLYMDPHKIELAAFTRTTGIQVSYHEVIDDMPAWFAQVQPQLKAGQSIGYDLMVITNGIQFKQFVVSGLLAPLDHARLPTYAANAAAQYKSERFDPGNVYSIPWASGMTGIAYNPEKVEGPITKLADLWNPAYKGRVGMFSDTQELGNFGMLALGIDPETSTPQDWQRAADKLKQQKAAGIVRKYYDQSYIDAFGSGEIWLTQAWSGDVFQKNASDGTNLQFVIPEEGGTIWTDNFTIPITAANPVDAIMLSDFFYRTEIAASLTEYITFVTPVPAAKKAIEHDAARASGQEKVELSAVAASPLVFPTQAELAKLSYYREFATVAEQQQYQSIFEPIVLS